MTRPLGDEPEGGAVTVGMGFHGGDRVEVTPLKNRGTRIVVTEVDSPNVATIELKDEDRFRLGSFLLKLEVPWDVLEAFGHWYKQHVKASCVQLVADNMRKHLDENIERHLANGKLK